MNNVSIQETKQQEFTKALKQLKRYIYLHSPTKMDTTLSKMFQNILNMMLFANTEKLLKTFKEEFAIFMNWLLVEVRIPRRLLLDYLKLIQNMLRKKYKRYSVTIDYYFDPTIFKKSFTHKKLFQGREKHIFAKQLSQLLHLDADIVLGKKQEEQMTTAKQTPTVVTETVSIPTVKQAQQAQAKAQVKGFLADIANRKKPLSNIIDQAVITQAQTVNKPFLGDVLSGVKLKKVALPQQTISPRDVLLSGIKKGRSALKPVAQQAKPTPKKTLLDHITAKRSELKAPVIQVRAPLPKKKTVLTQIAQGIKLKPVRPQGNNIKLKPTEQQVRAPLPQKKTFLTQIAQGNIKLKPKKQQIRSSPQSVV